MDAVMLSRKEQNTLLAALRALQYHAEHGRWPAGEAMQIITEIAGDGHDCATLDDMDDIARKIGGCE